MNYLSDRWRSGEQLLHLYHTSYATGLRFPLEMCMGMGFFARKYMCEKLTKQSARIIHDNCTKIFFPIFLWGHVPPLRFLRLRRGPTLVSPTPACCLTDRDTPIPLLSTRNYTLCSEKILTEVFFISPWKMFRFT